MAPGTRVPLLAAMSFLFAGGLTGPAAAEDPPPQIEGCLAAVGTYLTKNSVTDQEAGDFVSRSLLSLTNGGHVFFTDSAEAGSASFQPFSDGRGAWRCVAGSDGKAAFRAVVIDFTFADGANDKQAIGRLDFDLAYDESAQELSGSGKLGFAPFEGNPMDLSQVTEVAAFTLTGIRVDAP